MPHGSGEKKHPSSSNSDDGKPCKLFPSEYIAESSACICTCPGIAHGQARSFTSVNDNTNKTWSPLKHLVPVLDVLGNVPNSPVSAFTSLEKNPYVPNKPREIL